MIKITGPHNPALGMDNGRKFAYSGSTRVEVPLTTTLDDLEWIRPEVITCKQATKKIMGSRGIEYVLTKTGSKITCTCPGFKFNKKCKHTKEF